MSDEKQTYVDNKTEAKLLGAILCHPDQNVRLARFASVTADYFAVGLNGLGSLGRQTYQYVESKYVKNGLGIPSLGTLRDLTLPPQIKAYFETVDTFSLASLDDADFEAYKSELYTVNLARTTTGAITNLARHVQRSGGYALADGAALAEIERVHAAINLRKSDDVRVSSIHKDAHNQVYSLLMHYLDPEARLDGGVKTGWKVFDKVSGGLQPGQVCLLAANTGGGKSMGALQIAINAFLAEHRVGYVNLEMSEEDMTLRKIANVTETPFHEVWACRDMRKRQRIAQEFCTRFHLRSRGVYDEYSRAIGRSAKLSLRTLDALIAPNMYELLVIDYVSLLDRAEGDEDSGREEWLCRTVDAIHAFAAAKNCAILLLAQSNKDGELQHAKSMRNGVDFFLRWEYKVVDGVRPERVEVIIEKARNPKSDEASFWLSTREMRCCRLVDDDTVDADFRPTPPQPKPREGGM